MENKKIIPAILAGSKFEFEEKLAKVSSFAKEIQIDITDGYFTENKTLELLELEKLPEGIIFELHLMVNDPLDYLGHAKRLGIKRIIFHDEVEEDTTSLIEKIKKESFEVFLAINPETELSSLEKHIPNIDGVLIMSVEPGYNGQELIMESLGRAKLLKSKHPELLISMDGGIKKENIERVFDSGVSVAYVGSEILDAENPQEEYKFLCEKI